MLLFLIISELSTPNYLKNGIGQAVCGGLKLHIQLRERKVSRNWGGVIHKKIFDYRCVYGYQPYLRVSVCKYELLNVLLSDLLYKLLI